MIIISYGWIPEWPKGTDCKSAANCFGGSNPPPSIGALPAGIFQGLVRIEYRAGFISCLCHASAGVAEQADARDLKSLGGNTVPVQVRPPAFYRRIHKCGQAMGGFFFYLDFLRKALPPYGCDSLVGNSLRALQPQYLKKSQQRIMRKTKNTLLFL